MKYFRQFYYSVLLMLKSWTKWLLKRVGIWQAIEDGRLILLPSVMVPNYVVQRLFRVNGKCPWPVHYTSRVMAAEKIVMGRRVVRNFALSGGCYIQAFNGIQFGDHVIFGPGVKIISSNHDDTERTKNVAAQSIVIGHRCWIGANAIILPEVTLGDNVIVGAGAVVTKSFPSDVVIAGNPAMIIRHIKQ